MCPVRTIPVPGSELDIWSLEVSGGFLENFDHITYVTPSPSKLEPHRTPMVVIGSFT